MTSNAHSQASTDFEFTEAHFRCIADLAHERYGLSLAETKKPLVYSRLARRLRSRGLTDFNAYLEIVAHNQDDVEETAFITALTTNVTSFFRENHHFEILRTRGIPAMKKRLQSEGRARIWSAGCSSGEEPYSIAMTVLPELNEPSAQNVKILATDIDKEIIGKAKLGRYSNEAVSAIPIALRKSLMAPCGSDMITMSEDVRSMIKFAELNLIGDWPFNGPFDAIFCRNVAIYFDKPTQARLWQRFVSMLTDGGLLLIGHSERISGPAAEAIESIGITAYAKKSKTY